MRLLLANNKYQKIGHSTPGLFTSHHDDGAALDPRVEVAAYPDGRTTLVINNSLEPVTTTVPTPQGPRTVRLEEGGHQWLTAASQ